MTKKNKQKQGGKFINPGHSASAVQWYVRLTDSGSKVYLGDGMVSLSDCNKVIKWDLETANDIKKLRLAAAELTKAADAAEELFGGT